MYSGAERKSQEAFFWWERGLSSYIQVQNRGGDGGQWVWNGEAGGVRWLTPCGMRLCLGAELPGAAPGPGGFQNPSSG